MKLEDLQKFCGTDETRAALMRPFSIGDRTFATDGCLIVWSNRIPEVEESIEVPHGKVNAIVESWVDGPWLDLPKEIPAHETSVTCGDCDGIGPCENCDSTGVVEAKAKGVKMGNKILSNKYLLRIAHLPNIKLAANSTRPLEACPIKFDGGFGALMPMREN